uniref:Terminase n=1 Tax=viral metagenome TaxID=1070528 RepID=A0A6H1Z986_9ZZZZ
MYPIIKGPTRQPDGTYQIKITRAPGDVELISSPDHAKAQAIAASLASAAKLLIPKKKEVEFVQPGPGRPAKIKTHGPAVLSRIRKGTMSNDRAARLSGVNPATLRDWLARGKKEEARRMAGEPAIPMETQYLRFNAEFQCARDVGIEVLEDCVMVQAEFDGHLALKVLAVRRPEDWSRRQALEITGAGGGPIQVDQGLARIKAAFEQMTPEERKTAAATGRLPPHIGE